MYKRQAYDRLKAMPEWNETSIHDCLINMAVEKELKNGTVDVYKRQDIHYIMKKVNYFFYKRLSPVFKLCASTQTAWLFAPNKLLYRKILWRCV